MHHQIAKVLFKVLSTQGATFPPVTAENCFPASLIFLSWKKQLIMNSLTQQCILSFPAFVLVSAFYFLGQLIPLEVGHMEYINSLLTDYIDT
jgi:hypothetical protein